MRTFTYSCNWQFRVGQISEGVYLGAPAPSLPLPYRCLSYILTLSLSYFSQVAKGLGWALASGIERKKGKTFLLQDPTVRILRSPLI
jgi:hypothetical protein